VIAVAAAFPLAIAAMVIGSYFATRHVRPERIAKARERAHYCLPSWECELETCEAHGRSRQTAVLPMEVG
jgi:hypothetical protein